MLVRFQFCAVSSIELSFNAVSSKFFSAVVQSPVKPSYSYITSG